MNKSIISLSYISAEAMQKAAYNLREAASTKNPKEIKQYYLDLLIEAKVLKVYLSKVNGIEIDLSTINRHSNLLIMF